VSKSWRSGVYPAALFSSDARSAIRSSPRRWLRSQQGVPSPQLVVHLFTAKGPAWTYDISSPPPRFCRVARGNSIRDSPPLILPTGDHVTWSSFHCSIIPGPASDQRPRRVWRLGRETQLGPSPVSTSTNHLSHGK
jgi:hypothetical protein